ncbi:MAG: SusC/RagA family TonB-linked outer membrane protein [Bacteroidetes bacterium]|jgi:TonB-linked SusC/RagA family outer membrane protein|nr:SusC/RagA family TonB-linked outer membrane protein [Bacteroidota bacterium]
MRKLNLKCKPLTILFLLLFVWQTAYTQESRTITGKVVDENKTPLIGANIKVKNTLKGTVTDVNGEFSLEVESDDETIVVSYIGYESTELNIVNAKHLDITLSEGAEIAEVVVTALGIERDEKALGYAVQKLDAREVAAVQSTNVINNLSGKIAGVHITNNSSGPTSSSNIIIRGETSLTGQNQALFVVNGVPISNGLYSPGDGINGSTTIDFGNAAQIVNAHDIDNVSILKGPAAAALYGSRAAKGVVLITTKKGKATKGWGVELNSSTSIETPLKLPDYQNEYGFGGYGKFSYNDGTTYTGDYYDAFGENWGPRMNGDLIKQWNSNGEPVPFTPAEGNVRDFFQTGVVTTNNVAISNSTSNSDFRLSYTNLYRRGIVPNTNLERNTVYSTMGKTLFDGRLELRGNAMYVNSGSDNVPNAGYDESSSIMYTWLWFPRQVEMNELKDYWKEGREGEQQSYVEELWGNNPWFIVNENTNSFQESRLIGNADALYHFNTDFNIRIRFGIDNKDEQRQYRRATSTKGVPFGSYREDEISFTETNAEALLSYTLFSETDNLALDLKGGGNLMMQRSNQLIANNPQLLQPDLFTLTNNRSDILVDNPHAEKGIRSLFGMASLGIQNFIYLDFTARNDWSSTLKTEDGFNSYFYPSVSLSAILSEKMDLSTISALSFLKVRTAYAEVGNDTDPYLLDNYYEPEPLWGSTPAFNVSSFAAFRDLKPERTSSFEVGLDARFFNGRLGTDITFYDMLSSNQIIYLPVAISTGKATRLANAGEISNTGVEVQLYGKPVETSNFEWVSSLNVGHNKAIVETLPAGVEKNYPIVADVYPGDEGSADMELVAVEGEPLGLIRGLGFLRDNAGNIIHEDGLPVLTEDKVTAGSYQPDMRIGWQNTFSYNNWTFNILFDGQIGGKIYSRSHAMNNTGGTITNNDDPNLDMSTLDGRVIYDISYDSNGEPVYTSVDEGGVVGPGVMYNESGELVPNTVEVPVRDYFYRYYGNGFNRDNVEAATFDATYVKLRELKLTYRLPNTAIQNLRIEGASISIIGRNLLLFSEVPTIDPETYSVRNGIFVHGYESTQLPSVRSYGISLNLTL